MEKGKYDIMFSNYVGGPSYKNSYEKWINPSPIIKNKIIRGIQFMFDIY